jgi:hypothetical protein
MSPPPPKPVSSGHKKSERDQALKRKNQVQEKIGLNIQITTQVKTTSPHGDCGSIPQNDHRNCG